MPSVEVNELMGKYNLDEETAERVKDIMDNEGLDADDAIELEPEM